MLPKNAHGRALATKLKVYAGSEHPHAAQQPVPLSAGELKPMAERRTEYWGTGRRKTAVARVRLFTGEGRYVVNNKELNDYFGRDTVRMIVQQPLTLIQEQDKHDVIANVHGGGNSAQASAIRHGITRALLEMNPDLRPTLKKAGFITRDSREVERKKFGRHKARKRPQYSKR